MLGYLGLDDLFQFGDDAERGGCFAVVVVSRNHKPFVRYAVPCFSELVDGVEVVVGELVLIVFSEVVDEGGVAECFVAIHGEERGEEFLDDFVVCFDDECGEFSRVLVFGVLESEFGLEDDVFCPFRVRGHLDEVVHSEHLEIAGEYDAVYDVVLEFIADGLEVGEKMWRDGAVENAFVLLEVDGRFFREDGEIDVA